MKKWSVILMMFILCAVLVACNDDNGKNDQDETGNAVEDTTKTEKNNKVPDSNKNQDDADMVEKMAELDYTGFDMEVSYGENKEYETEIEQESSNVHAQLEDEINRVKLKGKKAFDKVYPNVKKLEVDRQTKKEKVISQVLEAFDLDEDYQKFEVEFTFTDGTKLSFEDKK